MKPKKSGRGLTIPEFCKEANADEQTFRGWLYAMIKTHQDKPAKSVREELRSDDFLKGRSNTNAVDRIYDYVLGKLREELASDLSTTFPVFCAKMDVNPSQFRSWMYKNRLSMTALRNEILKSRGAQMLPVYHGDALDRLYEPLVERLKAEFLMNPNLVYRDFCKRNNVSHTKMRHWMDRKSISVTEMRVSAKRALGISIDENNLKEAGAIYQSLLNEYKNQLDEDSQLSLASFCKAKDVDTVKMLKWMHRNHIRVCDLKKSCMLNGEKNDKDGFSKSALSLFRVTLDGYRKALSEVPYLKLRRYCTQNCVDYSLMRKWLRGIGLSERDLRRLTPQTSFMQNERNFIHLQFKPNGGAGGDKLTGVSVKMPSGASISMQECSIISLFSFLNMYKDESGKDDSNGEE